MRTAAIDICGFNYPVIPGEETGCELSSTSVTWLIDLCRWWPRRVANVALQIGLYCHVLSSFSSRRLRFCWLLVGSDTTTVPTEPSQCMTGTAQNRLGRLLTSYSAWRRDYYTNADYVLLSTSDEPISSLLSFDTIANISTIRRQASIKIALASVMTSPATLVAEVMQSVVTVGLSVCLFPL